MMTRDAVHTDPDILGGPPFFVGTRVPFHALIDYLEDGYTLDAFLGGFPSVTREQAVQSLEYAKKVSLADARSS